MQYLDLLYWCCICAVMFQILINVLVVFGAHWYVGLNIKIATQSVASSRMGRNLTLNLGLMTIKINMIHFHIICNLHLKFESDWFLNYSLYLAHKDLD